MRVLRVSPGCPCAPRCPRLLPEQRGNGDFALPGEDVTGAGGSGDTLLSPPCFCPHRGPRGGSVPPRSSAGSWVTSCPSPSAARAGGHGRGMRPPALPGLAPHPASAGGPGPGGALILQIPPGISPRRGPWERGAPPSLEALLGSSAQPWPEANTCAGHGLPTLGASGRARGQPGCGGTGWAREGRDGHGRDGTGRGHSPGHDPARIVRPDGRRGASGPGIPSPCRGALSEGGRMEPGG